MTPPKLFALCDSPTSPTGFGQVARELLTRFRPWFEAVDIWGINYHGAKYDRAQFPFHIFPAGGQVNGTYLEWNSPQRLAVMINEIVHGGYTHLWLLHDPSALTTVGNRTAKAAVNGLPQALKRLCAQRDIRSLCYFPVDAPMEPMWGGILDHVDVAVAYTEYGRREAGKVCARKDIKVLPHGVNRDHFHPLELPAKPFNLTLAGKTFFQVTAGRPLMVTVAAMNRRKDLPRALELLKALHERGCRAHWFLHTFGDVSLCDGVDLRAVGRQLKLEEQGDWSWTGAVLPELTRGLNPEEINAFYNAADVMLSTSLGEGWGLPITEALAAGCPVAAPAHTAITEIFNTIYQHNCARLIPLPLEPHGLVLPDDNARLRPRVDVAAAAEVLAAWFKNPKPRRGLNVEAARWLDWQRIAEAWQPLFFAPLGGGVDDILKSAGSRIEFAEASNFKSSPPEAANKLLGDKIPTDASAETLEPAAAGPGADAPTSAAATPTRPVPVPLPRSAGVSSEDHPQRA